MLRDGGTNADLAKRTKQVVAAVGVSKMSGWPSME